MTGTVIILPGGERFQLEWRRTDPERWERRLKAKYDESRSAERSDKARCLCQHRGASLPLQIRYRADSHNYHLAVWPNEGPLHEKTCSFYKPDPEKSGRASYVNSVIREGEDGDVAVTLSIGLRRKGPQFARHRTPTVALGRIASAGTRIRAQGRLISDLLCSVAPRHEKFGRRLHAIVRTEGKENHLFLIGFVEALEPNPRGNFTMALSGQRDGYRCFLTVPAAKRNRLVRSHQLAAATLALPEAARQAHVVAPNSRWRGWIQAEVRTGALMTVSRSMLPFESSHELAVTDALVAAGRAFEKPLRFDAERDLVFPDFILRDTARSAGYPMEVFGRTDAAYAARRAGKENYYNMTFGAGGWWSWDATTASRIPAFPSARKGAMLS